MNQITNRFGDMLGYWARATACAGLSQKEQGWLEARAALEIGLLWDWQGNCTWILPVVGIILGQKEQPERAAEIRGLYFNHPASPSGGAEKWPLLSEWQARLKESLGADGYRAAWERGRAMDLITTIEALLALKSI